MSATRCGASWPRGQHSVTIEGEPRMHVEFDAQWISDGLQGTAMHAVNAIPYVCEAPAGIRTLLDLPWLIARGITRPAERPVAKVRVARTPGAKSVPAGSKPLESSASTRRAKKTPKP